MAAAHHAPRCAWITRAHKTPCAAPVAYMLRLLTTAGVPLAVGACPTHLGPLIRRSLTHPTIVRTSVERDGAAIAELQSQLVGSYR
jgi:hypothetical protein